MLFTDRVKANYWSAGRYALVSSGLLALTCSLSGTPAELLSRCVRRQFRNVCRIKLLARIRTKELHFDGKSTQFCVIVLLASRLC